MNTRTQPDRQSDAALPRFARLRDEEAFAELMRRHGPMVLGVSLRMLHQRQDAEDALQAVFLTVAAKARALRRVRSVAGWLHNVAVRISLNLLKMNRRREQGLRKLRNERTGAHKSEPHSGALNIDEPDDLRAVLDEELAQLPARFKEAVILRDLEGYSRHEAAEVLGVPGGTVDSRLSRGRKLLRDRLACRGVTLGAGALAAMFTHGVETAPALGVELIHETYRNAQLFLAGTAAGNLSAATKIASLAQGVLHTMFLTRLSTTVCIVAMTAALVLGASPISTMLGLTSTVQAQSFAPFFDDFEDGNPMDGSPVTWSDYPAPYNLGTFQVTQGDLVISPATTGPVLPSAPNYREKDVVAIDRLYHDVNILARVRALTDEPSLVGIGVLDTHVTDGTVGVSVNAALIFDGSRRYLTLNNEVNQNFTQLGQVDIPVNHFASDVNLRVMIAGNQASFSVWPEGQAEPLVPQLQRIILSSFDNVQGRVIIFAGNAGTPSPVAFRFVEAIPEPSTAALGSLGLVALAAFGVRTRLARVRQPRA